VSSGNESPTNRLTTAPEEHSAPVSPNGKSRTSRPAHSRGFVRVSTSTTAVEGHTQQEIIDLTAEYCADRLRVLGQGNGNTARVFVVEACGYVCKSSGSQQLFHTLTVSMARSPVASANTMGLQSRRPNLIDTSMSLAAIRRCVSSSCLTTKIARFA